jgi:hypothetical protein
MGSGGGASASANLSITVSTAPPSSLSYGASAFTFTTNIAARTLTPRTQGAAAGSWSISPSLPSGLTFDTASGAISGTPIGASAPASHIVTAQNSGGQATATLTIEVDSGALLDIGHDSDILLLRMSGSSVLSVDQSGHWNLWDYASDSAIASGDMYCAPYCNPGSVPPPQFQPVPSHFADMAGGTAVLLTADGFELLSAATGQVLANITASASWWRLARDGSYLVAGSSEGLFAWSTTGNSLLSLSGDYSKATAFAAPGQIHVAEGPAGDDVIQTVSLPGGASTTGPAFNGQFSSWFLDGSGFIAAAGATALVYSLAGAQQAAITLPTGAAPTVGQGNWVWTVAGGTLDVFAIATGSTPAATFAVGLPYSVTPSATTIAVIGYGMGLSIVDLSGTTPSMATYTLPVRAASLALSPQFAFESNYAALSASQWMIGNTWGVLLDGASLAGSPRYFDLGSVWSIAGSSGLIAVATASGSIVYFDAGTLAQEGAIPFSASKVLLSSDGSVLAAAGDEVDFQYNDDWAIKIYSLPGAGLLYIWPYSYSNGVYPLDIALSASGAVLGQVLLTVNGASPTDYTQEAGPTTGGSQIFSTSFTFTELLTPPPPVRVSPDGSLIATSEQSIPYKVGSANPGTNILQNGNLVTAVTGWPVGWIDDGHLLVDDYKADSTGLSGYESCAVYSPTGQITGPCALPSVTAFQTVTSDSIYAVNLAEILSVGTGSVSWMSGDPASLSAGGSVGAVAGNRVVFLSGTKVLAQGY